MVVSMTEFINMLRVKNQLISFSSNELVEIYKDINDLLVFIDTIALLSEYDSVFLLFRDDFKEKIYSVLQSHRFSCDSEVKGIINEVISYLNGLGAYPDTMVNLLKNHYLAYQEELRHVEFSATDSFMSSIAEDAIVYEAITTGDFSKVDDSDYFMMSLNYLTEVCPELFKDEDVVKRSLSAVDSACREARIFSTRKKYIKESRDRLIKASKKEE